MRHQEKNTRANRSLHFEKKNDPKKVGRCSRLLTTEQYFA